MAIFLTAACSHLPPEQEVAVKAKYVKIDIPSWLFNKCSITEPPGAAAYVAMKFPAKEDSLVNYSIKLIGDLNKCNDGIAEIQKVYTQQQKLMDEINK